MVLDSVAAVLESIGAPWALIGGQAIALRGHPRMTLDFDFLTSDRRVFDRQVWKSLADRGATIDIRKGDADDPLGGVVHISLQDGNEADVVVSKWRWEQELIERAERMVIEGVSVPVPRASDLILLKLAAGGYIDRQDVYSLLYAGNRDALIAEVKERIESLPSDARKLWREILEERH